MNYSIIINNLYIIIVKILNFRKIFHNNFLPNNENREQLRRQPLCSWGGGAKEFRPRPF